MAKILVIEDEPDVRNNLVELLESEDFNVASSENGLMGALWAQQYLPDLIICDIMMPEIDGYEVLAALRKEASTATIPFVFLTAMADKANVRQGMELGADDYLTKPFTREELLRAVKTRLAKQQTVAQQYQAEHNRAQALKQRVQELQQHIETKEEVLQQLQENLSSTVPKLNIAINILKNLAPGAQRDRCLAILQTACTEEISMLSQLPYSKLFTAELSELLHQCEITNNER
jgi:two-component system, OmpR family, alkaline phosphatase synthesis response regulator PhoP